MLRSVLFGLAIAVLAALLWIVVVFLGPVAVPVLLSRFGNTGSGVGAGYVTSDSVLIAALVGFVAGFAWKRRRPRR